MMNRQTVRLAEVDSEQEKEKLREDGGGLFVHDSTNPGWAGMVLLARHYICVGSENIVPSTAFIVCLFNAGSLVGRLSVSKSHHDCAQCITKSSSDTS